MASRTLYIPDEELYLWLEAQAQEKGISFSGFIVAILEAYREHDLVKLRKEIANGEDNA
jgi:hypothetical protein